MSELETALTQAAAQPQASRTNAFLSILEGILKSSPVSAPALAQLITAAIQPAVGAVVSQAVVTEAAKRLSEKQPADLDERKNCIEAILQALSQRVVNYEEQISSLREQLADIFQEQEEWTDAAKALQGIPLESGQRAMSDEYKLQVYIRIVRLLLEDDDTVGAETTFKRAALIIHATKDRELLRASVRLDFLTHAVSFKLSQARIFDSQRRFTEAATRYHEISYTPELDEAERLAALDAAVTCAVLAPAGPQRSRVLATLHRDERTESLETRQILTATFLGRLIRPAQVEAFAATRKPHQMAKLPPVTAPRGGAIEQDFPPGAKLGPENVLDRAVMEHNLLSASRLYSNITFSGLGLLLSLTPGAAEAMARTMVQQGRLRGSLDQVNGLLTFDQSERDTEAGTSNVAAQAAAQLPADEEIKEDVVDAPETAKWDRAIRHAAQAVEQIASRIEGLTAA